MSASLYAFEAKSIQSYILEGGRLRDIVGASGLIDGLCKWPTGAIGDEAGSDLLGQVLQSLGPDANSISFVRRAAGGLISVCDRIEVLKNFRRLWTLAIQTQAPGLDFADAIIVGQSGSTIPEMMARLPDALRASRNRLSVKHPVPTAFVRRAPRTGGAVVEVEDDGDKETLDSSLHRKRWFAKSNLSREVGTSFFVGSESYVWPKNMEAATGKRPGEHFPFLKGNKYVGLLHADGNGLGQVIIDLSKALASCDASYSQKALKAFSQAIENATMEAAQDATCEHLEPVARACGTFPARPILLAGDDLTIILRGDLALPFAVSFLKKFEEHSTAQMTKFKAEFDKVADSVPDQLTAGAGLAFAKASVPFSEVLHLTEGLARFAKSTAKLNIASNGISPSSIAFFRQTGGRVGDFADEILPQELTARTNTNDVSLTAGPYGLDSYSGLQSIDTVKDIASIIGSSKGLGAKRAFKEMASVMQSEPGLAVRRYDRWREVAAKSDPGGLKKFDGLLDGEGCKQLRLPTVKGAKGQWAVPIFDALTLQAVSDATGDSNDEQE